jgi:hypothetical protein
MFESAVYSETDVCLFAAKLDEGLAAVGASLPSSQFSQHFPASAVRAASKRQQIQPIKRLKRQCNTISSIPPSFLLLL